MAKRKSPARKASRPTTRSAKVKTAARRTTGRAAGKSAARKRAKPAAKAGSRRAVAPKRPRATTPRSKTTKPKTTVRKPAPLTGAATRTAAPSRRKPTKKAAAPMSAAPAQKPRKTASQAPARRPRTRPSGLSDRDRPETPNSFNLDVRRTRKGTGAIEELVYSEDPDSDAALVAGDLDVDPDMASAVGDEAPGGDNPTPDMDAADLIGRSLGVEYADTEELQGADKIAARDRKRWELDPKSADDYRARNRS